MTLPTLPAAREEAQPKRVMQTNLGPQGGCQSACLAMMLGLPLSDVPNFAASKEAWCDGQAAWLAARGLWRLTIALTPLPARGFFIVGGVSPRGFRHSVIYRDGQLWHDPHPDGGGLVEVDEIDLLLPIGFVTLAGRLLDGVAHNAFPEARP